MEIRVALPLLLLALIGQTLSVNYKITKFSEKVDANNQIKKGAELNYDKAEDSTFPHIIGPKKTGFFCAMKWSKYRIVFVFPKDKELDIGLNVAVDSDKFNSVEKIDKNAEWKHSEDICILFGSWWPSETQKSKKLEIYIKILSYEPLLSPQHILYLKSDSKGGFLDSSLYINKIKKATKNPQTVQPNDLSTANRGNVEEPDLAKAQQIKDLISKFDSLGQTIFGNFKCDVRSSEFFKISLGEGAQSLQGDGELNMAFITKGINPEEEKSAAKEFEKSDLTKDIKTPWAEMKCAGDGIYYTSKYVPPEQETTQQQDFTKALVGLAHGTYNVI